MPGRQQASSTASAAAVRQTGSGPCARSDDHDGGRGVREDDGDPFGRVGRVDRDDDGAGLQHGEDSRDGVGRAWQGHGDAVPGSTPAARGRGRAGRPRVELARRSASRRSRSQRRGASGVGPPWPEQRRHGGLAAPSRTGGVPLDAVPGARSLGGPGRRPQPVRLAAGPRRKLSSTARKPAAQPLGGGPVEQVGA